MSAVALAPVCGQLRAGFSYVALWRLPLARHANRTGIDTLGIWPAETFVTIRQTVYCLRATTPRYLAAVGSQLGSQRNDMILKDALRAGLQPAAC